MLAAHVRQVEAPLLEEAGARVEAQVIERVPSDAAEEAVVRVRHVDRRDVAVVARAEDLLRLDNLRRLEAAESVEAPGVVLDLEARRAPLDAGEDGLVDGRRGAAPRDVVEVPEAEAVGVEREERRREAFARVAARVVEEAKVRTGVVEGRVEVAGVRRQRVEVEAEDDRGFRRQAGDEAGHLLVHDEVGQVLAAREARVQRVEEEAVLRAVADGEAGRQRDELPGGVQEVVVAEGPRDAGVHEVPGARARRCQADGACAGGPHGVVARVRRRPDRRRYGRHPGLHSGRSRSRRPRVGAGAWRRRRRRLLRERRGSKRADARDRRHGDE